MDACTGSLRPEPPPIVKTEESFEGPANIADFNPVNPAQNAHVLSTGEVGLFGATSNKTAVDLGNVKQEEHNTTMPDTDYSYIRGDSCLENLETGVAEGLKALEPLKLLLQKYPRRQLENQWLRDVKNLKIKSKPIPVIIGVVGSTGAGKSSLINAVLDEECLVPTNCMRACTAVITEISFNHGPGKYRAAIEFISPAEWERELKLIFDEIRIQGGEGQYQDDSDVAIAIAKVEAVYPGVKDIMASSIEELMKHDNVRNLLGKTTEFTEDDPSRFHTGLQEYVDSKNKARRKNTKGKGGNSEKDHREKLSLGSKTEEPRMEFWPLVRVVRLYTKAPALATGAVIVDLPGLQDSNAARGAVAARYIEKCSFLWIAAPITRAVDDKTAKKLLSNTFKRQIQMDGSFNNVSFICTKTDDINVTEMEQFLDPDEIMGGTYEDSDDPEIIPRLEEALQTLKDERNKIDESVDQLVDEMYQLESTFNSFISHGSPLKRKKDDDTFLPCTEQSFPRTNANDLPESSQNDGEIDRIGAEGQAAALAKQKWREAFDTRKRLMHRKREVRLEVENVTRQLKAASEDKQKKHDDHGLRCILERNKLAKSQIRRDYANGVQQLDRAHDEFDPAVSPRDYDDVANRLPVFCVSSRAYQKLQGRFQRDGSMKSFKHIEATEVPALQAHCNGLAAEKRKATCRTFLNGLEQLLNSLDIFCSSGGLAELCEDQKKSNLEFIQARLDTLENQIEELGREVVAAMIKAVNDNVFDKLGLASAQACSKANDAVDKWNRPQKDGGLAYNTYQAICKRQGNFWENHWNLDLTEPMMEIIACGWETAFSRLLPQMLVQFAESSSAITTAFHAGVEAHFSAEFGPTAWMQKLKVQLKTYDASFHEISASGNTLLKESHKASNRAFAPVIAGALEEAYNECTEQSGKGVLVRMKQIMAQNVEDLRHSMFDDSAEHVKSQLEEGLASVRDTVVTESEDIFSKIASDYKNTFEQSLSEKEKELNKAMAAMLLTLAVFRTPNP
ncbi:hypothetical protein FQN52_007747 [Onygenales sp. PD_12]|nr:hypothetical protein FQN52_007747 [Onygenales sp. PD_12]